VTVVAEVVMGVTPEAEVLQARPRRQRQAAVVVVAAPRLVGRHTTTLAVPSVSMVAGKRTAVPGSTETGHPTESRAYDGRLCLTPPDNSATTGIWSCLWRSSTISG